MRQGILPAPESLRPFLGDINMISGRAASVLIYPKTASQLGFRDLAAQPEWPEKSTNLLMSPKEKYHPSKSQRQ
jgi:hypothetical protein